MMSSFEGKMFGEIIKSKPLVLQSHRYKIDPNKIQTLDDVIQILRRVDMHVDDEGVKGIEHLIEKEESVSDYKITAVTITKEQLS